MIYQSNTTGATNGEGTTSCGISYQLADILHTLVLLKCNNIYIENLNNRFVLN
jgi:hypothetical protein